MVALLRSQHSTKCLTLFLAGLAIYLLWMDVGFYLELQVAASYTNVAPHIKVDKSPNVTVFPCSDWPPARWTRPPTPPSPTSTPPSNPSLSSSSCSRPQSR